MASPLVPIPREQLASMSDHEIADELIRLLRRVVPTVPDGLSLESDLVNDIGIDSLGGFELLMSTEEHFSIEIPDEKLRAVGSLGEIVTLIRTQATK